MEKVLTAAQVILSKTDDFKSFEEKYNKNLRFHGDRLADGATFVFDIANGYSLIINFSDYSYRSFSIIHESLDGDTLTHI